MIVITTMDLLPEHCFECPCHDGESGYCQADKEQRYSDYRPYWCPLKEIIQCKDCKPYNKASCDCERALDRMVLHDNWFCADGNRED